MKRTDITRDVILRAVDRSTRASAALERREIPVGFVRSTRVEQFLADRKQNA
ncbi:hypothetical protein [Microbacterium sp.]|uniref:hypothetical protein n=1 Tax=Microbacterium sp. TaxID=51671 RepID=UPI0039E394A6